MRLALWKHFEKIIHSFSWVCLEGLSNIISNIFFQFLCDVVSEVRLIFLDGSALVLVISCVYCLMVMCSRRLVSCVFLWELRMGVDHVLI